MDDQHFDTYFLLQFSPYVFYLRPPYKLNADALEMREMRRRLAPLGLRRGVGFGCLEGLVKRLTSSAQRCLSACMHGVKAELGGG